MGGGGLDFRAILKSKVPHLSRLDEPSFERIYQTFSEQVGKHGLSNLDSYYKTAGRSGNIQLQAIQERVAQQASGGPPNTQTQGGGGGGPPSTRGQGGGSGTTVNVFSPESMRQPTPQPPFSPELARAQGAQPPPAGPSDPSLRGGAGPVASPEALRTGMGSGTVAPDPRVSPESIRTGMGAGTTTSTADANMLAMAERAGAGTVSDFFSPELARAQGAQPPPFSPEAQRTGVGAGTASNFSPEAQRGGVGSGTTGQTHPAFEGGTAAARPTPHPAFEGGTAAARPTPSTQYEGGWDPTNQSSLSTADANMVAMAENAGAGTTGPTSAETMAWLQTDDAQRLIAAQGQGGQEWPNQPPVGDGGGGVPPVGGGGGGVPPVGGGGGGVPPAGGGVPATAGFNAPTDLTGQINTAYDTLAATTQEQFGGLQTQDFSDQIRALVESGRVSMNELNAQQLATLQQSEQRRMGQIGDIQGQLQGDLGQQEQYRQDIQRQVAEQAAVRAGQMTADQQARIQASRGALGGQVTSEFEEVAALTGGLTGSQAQSTTAGMDRLAQVANQGAASRLAAPAQLAAEAKMAVGDEKFRLENQLAQSLSEGMAELNIQEQQQVMQEAMRQEQFGIQRDQALATALTNIAGQRTGATLGEQGRLQDISQRQGEITQQQAYQSGESIAQRDWQSGEAADQRTWQGQQAVDQRDWQKTENETQATARLNEFTQNFDQSATQFAAKMEFDEGQALEAQFQFDTMDLFRQGEYDEGVRQFNKLNPDLVPDESPLGQLNQKYPDIDMGLKAIAIGMTALSTEVDPETGQSEQGAYLKSLTAPQQGGMGTVGSKPMSQEDAAIIAAMLGVSMGVLSAQEKQPYENMRPAFDIAWDLDAGLRGDATAGSGFRETNEWPNTGPNNPDLQDRD